MSDDEGLGLLRSQNRALDFAFRAAGLLAAVPDQQGGAK